MTAACAFCAEGGICFATTVKMYDAASAGVRLANTGPDCLPSDCTAARPRSASAAVSGCHPDVALLVVPDVVAVPVDRGLTLAYQYHTHARMTRMIMRQPSRLKKPFIVRAQRVSDGGEYPRTSRAR